ncbi:MAG: hypothetical protein WEG56_11590, partial [Chloroflexota bacterium]
LTTKLSGDPGRLAAMRRSAPLLVALALVVVGHLFVPRPALACSCVPPMDSIQMAAQDPEATIFTATTGPTVGDSMQVLVTRWFRGQPIAGVAAIQVLLGDSAMCGMMPLPVGHEYLFQTYPSENSRHALSGCSPQADLSTPDGQALLARTIQLYGAGAPPTDPPATTTAAPTAAGPVDAVLGTAVPITLVVAFALGLLVGAIAVLRRRRDA